LTRSTLDDVAMGSALASVGFLLIFTGIPLPVHASTNPGYFFSMTFVVPTSNPSRQQQAAIIAQNLMQIHIDVRLIYMTFGTMAGLTFGCSLTNCGLTYAEGGFDAGIVGFGGGPALPDFGTQDVVIYRSLTNSDYSPTGANFIHYHNDTYNKLAAQYNADYNSTDRAILAKKMVEIILQDRPDMPIWESTDQFVVANTINQWGDHAQESSVTINTDFQHWSVSQGDSINVAVRGPFTSSLDQFLTANSDDYFNAYLYNPTAARLEELDGRTVQYTKALATTIAWSPNHLTWTVSFRPHDFQDGVPVTADDYLFSMMGTVVNDVGSIQGSTFQGILGDYSSAHACNCSGIQFTYLNGTSDFVQNGNYTHGNSPMAWKRTSLWTAINDTAFSFTLSQPYLWADPVLTGFSAAPMHIFEAIPFDQWDTSPFATFHDTPYVYTYNHQGQANNGGNGSGTAYGPIGDGPYYYHGYNSTSGVGTLVKWDGYWNATGLESLGLFNANLVRIIQIPTDQVVSAFQTGEVNFVDNNYFLTLDQDAAMVMAGGHLTHQSSPAGGWREFFLQLTHPVWGTGTGTPNGQRDPAHAEVYARYVRAAISHAIPRQEIVDTFYHGLLNPGITEFCTCFTWAYPPGTQPDSYDLSLSMSLLAKAGYTLTNNLPPPAPPFNNACGSVEPPLTNETIPSFLEGQTFTPSGTFAIPVSTGNGTQGFYATLEESVDNGTTWNPVALTIATEGGYYSFSYAPTITGTVWYRVFFSGIPATEQIGYSGPGPNTPAAIESFVPPFTSFTGESPLNITDTQYGAITKLQIVNANDTIQSIIGSASLRDAEVIHAAMCNLTSSTNQSLSNFNASTTAELQAASIAMVSKSDLTNAVNALQGGVATTANVSYLALAAAVVLGAAAIVIAIRKPKPR
jgi:ABC-type transport system substrate-binding protein